MGQIFHFCSILDTDSCLLFCLMQMTHPMPTCTLYFHVKERLVYSNRFCSFLPSLMMQPEMLRKKFCCASGIFLDQIFSQRDNLPETWALKRMLKIVLNFWNTGQWHWNSEKMSSPNSHFIKGFAYFLIITAIIPPSRFIYKGRKSVTNFNKSEFGYKEPSVNSGIRQ